jgi:hypothetical protein
MRTPEESTSQRFFLTVDGESGEILCAHQEYVAERPDGEGEGRLRPSDGVDDDHVLDIALKASPAARDARDRLRVVRLECPPTTDFSRHRVELESGELVGIETAEPERTETSLSRPAGGGTRS